MRLTFVMRLTVGIVALTALVLLLINHPEAGLKGTPVFPGYAVVCLVAAAVAAFACARYWRWSVAPILGGAVGGLVMAPLASPYGGLLGLLAGLLVIVVLHPSQHRSPSPNQPARPTDG